jgi:mono/diheme cytochrome c family protein
MKHLYLIAALLVIAGCAVLDPDPEAVVVNPVAIDTVCSFSHALSGARLFYCHCSGCHGETGRPIVLGVPDLTLRTPAFGRFDTVLNVGPGASPRFPQLDSIARRKLYAFVTTLRK